MECGGNRRQKAADGRLDAATGSATTITRRNDRWNVMVVGRQADEWYVGGTMAAFTGPPPFGWVQRIDPATLEPLASSPELPCGEHVWCGAILAHANGSIISVNGSYLHRLAADDLSVQAERRLPVERSHNGMLSLADGTILTKDLRLEGQGGTTLTRLDPDSLELVGDPLVLPEGSMGRIAADLVVGADGDTVEHVYVPGTEHLWRLIVEPDRLRIDDGWRPRYREAGGDYGLSWDACISDGSCWVMDCGDVASVRRIHTTEPNGRFDEPPGRSLSWRLPAPWSGPQRLLQVPLDDADGIRAVAPFGISGGGIIAPPVHVPGPGPGTAGGVAVAWDSVNGGLAGIGVDGSELEPLWTLDVRPSMQPVVFPESGELVINDFTDEGTDDLVVVDVRTGALIDRVETGSRIGNGMFLTAGGRRDVFYCTTTTLARIVWQ